MTALPTRSTVTLVVAAGLLATLPAAVALDWTKISATGVIFVEQSGTVNGRYFRCVDTVVATTQHANGKFAVTAHGMRSCPAPISFVPGVWVNPCAVAARSPTLPVLTPQDPYFSQSPYFGTVWEKRVTFADGGFFEQTFGLGYAYSTTFYGRCKAPGVSISWGGGDVAGEGATTPV